MPKKNQAFIVNLGPAEWIFSRSYGQIRVLGCAPGEEYRVTTIDDHQDRLDMGDDNRIPIAVDAEDIAHDVVQNEHLEHFGVAVIADEKPTRKELEQARARMLEYYRQMLSEGDMLWAKYHRHELIDDNSKIACQVLGVDREWSGLVESKMDCPGCGKKVLPTIARHECGYILNIDAALDGGMISEEQAEQMRKRRGKAKAAKAGE